MNITMLGTGNASVTECYNTCFVSDDDGKYFLIDGGGGNTLLRQLKLAGVDWRDVRDIFITHKHVDHLMGIMWMVRMICQSMSRGKYDSEARIYGHSEVIALIRGMAEMLYSEKEIAYIDDRLHLITVEDGETLNINGRDVTFFDIGSTKAKQFGFSMLLDDGKKLTCCGDEPCRECEEKYARESEWLLHEAFCLYSEREEFKPYQKHHSIVKGKEKIMDYRRFGDTIVARIDRDEEIMEQIKVIALKEDIKLAKIQALGAVKEFTVGVYKTDTKEYIANEFSGAYEITSLIGTIDTMNGEYYSHLHMSAGNEKGEVFGGHLNKAVVGATCEMIITLIDGRVDRVKDESIGLNIFRF